MIDPPYVVIGMNRHFGSQLLLYILSLCINFCLLRYLSRKSFEQLYRLRKRVEDTK